MSTEVVVSPRSGELVEILAHAARNADGEGSLVLVRESFQWLVFELIVTAVAGAVMDFRIQQSHDGENVDDLVSIAAVGAVGGYTVSIPLRERDATGEIHAWTDGTLPGGSVRATVLAKQFRAHWRLTSPGTITFQVLAVPRR